MSPSLGNRRRHPQDEFELLDDDGEDITSILWGAAAGLRGEGEGNCSINVELNVTRRAKPTLPQSKDTLTDSTPASGASTSTCTMTGVRRELRPLDHCPHTPS